VIPRQLEKGIADIDRPSPQYVRNLCHVIIIQPPEAAYFKWGMLLDRMILNNLNYR
jgi:hypothetical protein